MSIPPIPEDKRMTTYPIARNDIWEYYKRAVAAYWVVGEVPISTDKNDFYTKLTSGQQHSIKRILAFFAAADGLVNANLAARFRMEIEILEVGYFYDFQIMMENIHAEMYSVMLFDIIEDARERNLLLKASETIPIIKKMSEWITDCISSDEPLARRLLRMACVEGIFFAGCFCIIFWITRDGLMPGLGLSNKFIARDEGLHTVFALKLYSMCEQLTTQEVYDIFDAAIGIAVEFTNSALPEPLPEMNAELMSQYMYYIADTLMSMIDVPKKYNVDNPFGFMEQQGLLDKTNFFERRISNYSKPKSAQSTMTMQFNTDDEF